MKKKVRFKQEQTKTTQQVIETPQRIVVITEITTVKVTVKIS